MLTDAQVVDYHRDGFVIARGLYSHDELQPLYDAYRDDPSIGGSNLKLRLDGLFLRTHNRSASINGAVEEDDLYPDRQFRIDQVDARATLMWRNGKGIT